MYHPRYFPSPCTSHRSDSVVPCGTGSDVDSILPRISTCICNSVKITCISKVGDGRGDFVVRREIGTSYYFLERTIYDERRTNLLLGGVELETKGEEEKKKRRKGELLRLSDKNGRNTSGESFHEWFGKRRSPILGAHARALCRNCHKNRAYSLKRFHLGEL